MFRIQHSIFYLKCKRVEGNWKRRKRERKEKDGENQGKEKSNQRGKEIKKREKYGRFT